VLAMAAALFAGPARRAERAAAEDLKSVADMIDGGGLVIQLQVW
jgi:hypothetical protein